MELVALLLISAALAGVASARERCDHDKLAVYKLVLDTHWSMDLFPKQYPEVRPPAQWSALVGRSHDENYTLFREGVAATDAMKLFVETGRRDALDDASQGQGGGGVCDEFVGQAIKNGTGKMETRFFADGNHTRLSAAVRIVPSPDWFVGLDSVDLCSAGFWIESMAFEASPLDGGTDDGFTFTAPNWPSEPRQHITRITSREPHHPANSFFYPAIDQLPVIATFHLIKERHYKMSTRKVNNNSTLHAVDEISNELAPRSAGGGGGGGGGGGRRRKGHKNRRTRQGPRHQEPCHVGEWSVWTPCSVSCGVGEQTRTRHVLRHGSTTCPSTTDTRWCGEHTQCPQNFFNW